MEIIFKDISPSDRIMIRTQNSEYRFSVLDPDERRGILTGGSLGNQQRNAVLVGTLSGGGNSFASDASKLKTGSRALFYLTAKNGVERLITSIITNLKRSHSRNEQREAA
ncbi:MAG TPA: hypothetical protein VNI02_08560 [Blastocatellia bacterium]|jgi:hypothetical protein|nr:hypothetical protein [Blastocatellia bacterium]